MESTLKDIESIIRIADKHTINGAYRYIRLMALERALYRKEGKRIGLLSYDEQLVYWNRLKRIAKNI